MSLHPAYECTRCRRTVYWAEGHACLQTFDRSRAETHGLPLVRREKRMLEALVDRDPGDESEAA